MKNKLINIDPEIMGGTPVFAGTRVPIESLFQHLEAGIPLEEFLDDFPSVSKEQAIHVLGRAWKYLDASIQLTPENFTVPEAATEKNTVPQPSPAVSKSKFVEHKLVNVNPRLMSGTPVFAGTRVPIESLFQHLESGVTIAEFCDDFDTVSQKQARQVLALAQKLLLTNFTLVAHENNIGRKRAEVLAA